MLGETSYVALIMHLKMFSSREKVFFSREVRDGYTEDVCSGDYSYL